MRASCYLDQASNVEIAIEYQMIFVAIVLQVRKCFELRGTFKVSKYLGYLLYVRMKVFDWK